MEFREIVKKRRSTRRFKTKIISKGKIRKIFKNTLQAPSSGNFQSYKIFVLENKKDKNNLTEASGGQSFIAEAPLVLIFFADPEKNSAKYGERGESLYSIQDATIAACFAWLAAVDLGLSAVWVGAFDEQEVKEICGVKNSLRPVVIMPLGYAAERPENTSRQKIDEIVEFV